MKKTIALFGLLFFLSHWASAQTMSKPFYIGLGTGVDLPASGWDPNYYVGGGAHFFLGDRLDPFWSVQLDIQDWAFLGGDKAQYHFRFIPELKAVFEGQGWQPYALAGAGLSLRTFYYQGNSAADLDLLAGLGAQIDLGGDSHLFVQAALNALAANPMVVEIPLTAGLWVGL
jgi:hypothetical protein